MLEDSLSWTLRPTTLVNPLPPAALDAVAGFVAGDKATLLYCHGIKNKPPIDVIKCQWDTALNQPVAVSSRMAYWVDRGRYPQSVAETCQSPDITHGVEDAEGFLAEAQDIPDATPEELAWLASLEAAMLSGPEATQALLWGPIDRALLKLFTRAFMKDAHDYFFRQAAHDRIEKVFTDALNAIRGPVVVVGHSLGSVIAYEALRKLRDNGRPVPLFVTIGSPLGLGPIQAVMKTWSGAERPYPRPPMVDRWINVKAKGDVIASDLDTDYGRPVGDVEEYEIKNIHRDAHSSDGYLRIPLLRQAIKALM